MDLDRIKGTYGSNPPAAAWPRDMRRACWITVGVAALFCLWVTWTLIRDDRIARVETPLATSLTTPILAALQAQLARAPQDEKLKSRIRAYDLELRERFFRHLRFQRQGVLLLGVGLLVLVVALSLAGSGRAVPLPGKSAGGGGERFFRARGWMRGAVLGMAVAITAVFVAQSINVERNDSRAGYVFLQVHTDRDVNAVGDGSTAGDAWLEARQQWPCFRGADGNATSVGGDAPVAWNGASGTGILWKSVVPMPGHSSPVVWSNRVFLTGATREWHGIFAYDLETGQLVWSNVWPMALAAGQELQVMEDTGYAASTPATDGRFVWAIFADGDFKAIDVGGRERWFRRFGPLANQYGHASSLATCAGLVILQLDQGTDAAEGKSRLLALQGATGATIWETRRPVPNSWASPAVYSWGGTNLVLTAANPWVIAYDARNGREIWRAECIGGDVAPSPVSGAGMVYAVNAYSALAAIRWDGRGDVTTTHVAWKAVENLPDICSPLYWNGLLFILTSGGTLTCYDAVRGEKVWDRNMELTCFASPAVGGDRMYITAESGTTLVLEPGREYREIGRAELGERIHASMAFRAGRILMRGAQHLWCVGNK